MNKETIEEIAKKLQVPAELIWGALIKQAPINGITDICSYTLYLLLTILGAILFYKFMIKADSDEASRCQQEHYMGFAILCGVFSVLFFLVFIINISHLSLTISCFTNPEYWALKQIIK